MEFYCSGSIELMALRVRAGIRETTELGYRFDFGIKSLLVVFK
jgi:hypothetical protein